MLTYNTSYFMTLMINVIGFWLFYFYPFMSQNCCTPPYTENAKHKFFFFQFLDNKFVAVSTNNGTVKLYRVIGENEALNIHLEEVTAWNNLHSFGYIYNFFSTLKLPLISILVCVQRLISKNKLRNQKINGNLYNKYLLDVEICSVSSLV